MLELGIKAIALSSEALQAATAEGRDLLKEIRQCKWAVVLLSAERLVSPEVDAIVRDPQFRKNLVLLGIDETHLLVPWGKDFRQAYRQMALLHKRLPKHTALVAVTATLAEGREMSSLISALGLKPGRFHCIRLSSERPNVRTIIQELTHTLGGYKFPDILYLLAPPIKSVIYCQTIDLSFRVACYAWNQYPSGTVGRLENVRLWSSLTSAAYNQRTLELFENNINTTTIVATIAFGMGMNLRNITHSVNLGLPTTLSALVQQNGRAGDVVRCWASLGAALQTDLMLQFPRQFLRCRVAERRLFPRMYFHRAYW